MVCIVRFPIRSSSLVRFLSWCYGTALDTVPNDYNLLHYDDGDSSERGATSSSIGSMYNCAMASGHQFRDGSTGLHGLDTPFFHLQSHRLLQGQSDARGRIGSPGQVKAGTHSPASITR